MTDLTLTDALAEVKRADLSLTGHRWTGDAVQQTDRDNEADVIATILNAAASGALIPRADADLAVALVVERAADALGDVTCPAIPPICMSGLQAEAFDKGQRAAVERFRAAVLALAPAVALAEVQALRAERDQQKNDANKWFDLALSNRHALEAAEAKLAALVEASWQMLIEYDEVNLDHPEPTSMTAAVAHLRAALAAAKGGAP